MTDHADTIRRAIEIASGRDGWIAFINSHSGGELREFAVIKREDAAALLAERQQLQERLHREERRLQSEVVLEARAELRQAQHIATEGVKAIQKLEAERQQAQQEAEALRAERDELGNLEETRYAENCKLRYERQQAIDALRERNEFLLTEAADLRALADLCAGQPVERTLRAHAVDCESLALLKLEEKPQ